MAAVQQRVLNWLYSVLTSEYQDVNRTYNDVAQSLSHYSSLAPKTDVYTYEHGASALLLQLSGTLPVMFRGTIYRFPIQIWVPHAYPYEAPLVYVAPTEGMMVRAGQHVDQQGKVYHPYLVGWAEFWDKSNITDFLAILRDIFAKEPPVISRQQQRGPPRESATPPPIPPLPPQISRPIPTSPSPRLDGDVRAPLPPPKPSGSPQPYSSSGPSRRDGGPPLPPLPTDPGFQNSRYNQQLPHSPGLSQHAPQRSSSLRFEAGPPLPQLHHTQQSIREGPYSPASPPSGLNNPAYTQNYQQVSHEPKSNLPNNGGSARMPPLYIQQQQRQQQQPYPNQNQQLPQWHQQQPPVQQSTPKPPISNLLDSPLTLPLPSNAALPAPPVPPNPETGMLLHAISSSLSTTRQQTRAQAASSLPSLASQHAAMLTTLSSMQAELSALSSLSTLLSSNKSVLHASLHDADAVIANSQHSTPPSVDDLLVAPTVVGNQLYDLVAEERSLNDALFMLGRAVERGRISPQVFTKMTRSLARELFLKKMLVREIGLGMGLHGINKTNWPSGQIQAT